MERYSRQIPIVGEEGQRRLRESIVLVAGAGGLGSFVLLHLAAMGVGRIMVVDNGRVELSNLNRQVLYTVDDIGREKAVAAAERLRGLNPETRVEPYVADIEPGLIDGLVAESDIVVDALDNWEARQVLNEAAVRHGKPLVHGGVNSFYGQVMVVRPCHTPCLACLFPRRSPPGPVPVVSPVVGLVASIQAVEALKLITGAGRVLDKLLIIDADGHVYEAVEVRRNPGCPVCGRYCGGGGDGSGEG